MSYKGFLFYVSPFLEFCFLEFIELSLRKVDMGMESLC